MKQKYFMHVLYDSPYMYVMYRDEDGYAHHTKPYADYEYHYGKLRRVDSYTHGVQNHIEGNPPTHASWYMHSRDLMEVEYHVKGCLQREDGPASRHWAPNGILQVESWYHEGHRHRTDGPAHILYNPYTGHVTCEAYYVYGKKQAPKAAVCE
tara:strand:+ start:1834 stop:2289 length:456 start_codon:yes stop_codon:yes gene_type:complete